MASIVRTGAGTLAGPAQSKADSGKDFRHHSKFMKTRIIVQHRRTRAYASVGEQHQWTDYVANARLFATPYHALHFCVNHEVKNADVVFRYPDGGEERFLLC